MEITKLFERIIRKQKEIGYHFPTILNSPATLLSIKEIENVLDLEFNSELVDLYLFADGTFFYDDTPSGKTGLLPIFNFLSLNDSVQLHALIDTVPEHFQYNDGSILGSKLFPFLNDFAGDSYWVDLNGGNNHGRILLTSKYKEPDYVFDSLTQMFVAVWECYETDVFTLDHDGFLDCDYERFRLVGKKYSSNKKYWTRYL